MATLKVPVTEADHAQGNAHAPLTLVEYGDYECPHCRRADPIVKLVQEHFGDRLRFVFRNFPLTQMHPNAEAAAETAEFAAAHKRFWQMHDGIFENQDSIGLPLYLELAKTLELPVPDLRSALLTHEFAPRVREDVQGGIRSGVNGTPTFFINTHRHDGPFDFESLIQAIDQRLAEGK
jgi:protein-disulfide isomerase